ncbi:serine hydrolase domain-containing protein [Microbacterium sp.]|uniref:serine hydrolase domain-containing protein n=1 Tax=Microbacterium sp. TaxID=51671 RepID=UPI003C71DAC8
MNRSEPDVTVGGADPGLEPAVSAFRELIVSGEEPGASLSVWRQGRPVLEAWGGFADADRTKPWTSATLAMTYSTGKPLAALAALLAVREGFVTLDDPVIRWWPEYGQGGKERTTLRYLLSHRAGMSVFPEAASGIDPLDKDALIHALAAAECLSEPGTAIAEHAMTYGHLIDGLLAAAGAVDIRTTVAEVTTPLGATLWFGVPYSVLGDVAALEIIDENWVAEYLANPLAARALSLPAGRLVPAHVNSAPARQASFPADGLFATASGLARFYDDLSRPGGRIARALGPVLWEEYLRPHAVGHDAFLDGPAQWSLGLSVDEDEFGMGGIGGSCAWYSRRHDYAMAYVTRGLGTFDRVDAVAHALETALAELPDATLRSPDTA